MVIDVVVLSQSQAMKVIVHVSSLLVLEGLMDWAEIAILAGSGLHLHTMGQY